MNDLYFIPKCVKPMFERRPDGTPIRMLSYSLSAIPGNPYVSPYPSQVYKGTDYFKALKRISEHEASMIQQFLMDRGSEYQKLCYDPSYREPFEVAVQQWPKAPKINAVYFLTHGIRLVINDKMSEWTDIQVQEGDKIFKSYLYSILQLIFDKPYTLIQDVLHGQFLTFQFIRKIIFNNRATIIIWDDGSKTVSKCLPTDIYNEETGVLLCILKKFYRPSHLNKMFKNALDLRIYQNKLKKENQNPICPYCKERTMVLHHTFHALTMPNEIFYECNKCCSSSVKQTTQKAREEVFYECSKCHSRSPVKQTEREAKEAAMKQTCIGTLNMHIKTSIE